MGVVVVYPFQFDEVLSLEVDELDGQRFEIHRHVVVASVGSLYDVGHAATSAGQRSVTTSS